MAPIFLARDLDLAFDESCIKACSYTTVAICKHLKVRHNLIRVLGRVTLF